MKTQRERVFVREDIWREGKYLDLWSVVHFLSGCSLGLGLYFLDFGQAASIVIAFILLVAYEMWEAMVKIEETPQNRVLDVVVGMTSFLPTFLYLSPLLSRAGLVIAFAIVLFLNISLATLGWLESRKAEVLEARMRAEYERERARMIERRAKLRARLERRRFRKER